MPEMGLAPLLPAPSPSAPCPCGLRRADERARDTLQGVHRERHPHLRGGLVAGAWGMRILAFRNIRTQLAEHFKDCRPDLSFEIRCTSRVNFVAVAWKLFIGYQAAHAAILATPSQGMAFEQGQNDRAEPLLSV